MIGIDLCTSVESVLMGGLLIGEMVNGFRFISCCLISNILDIVYNTVIYWGD
jgi:hypothetical protein